MGPPECLCETISIQCVFKDRKGDLSRDMSIGSKSMTQMHIMKFNKAKCKVLNMIGQFQTHV